MVKWIEETWEVLHSSYIMDNCRKLRYELSIIVMRPVSWQLLTVKALYDNWGPEGRPCTVRAWSRALDQIRNPLLQNLGVPASPPSMMLPCLLLFHPARLTSGPLLLYPKQRFILPCSTHHKADMTKKWCNSHIASCDLGTLKSEKSLDAPQSSSPR